MAAIGRPTSCAITWKDRWGGAALTVVGFMYQRPGITFPPCGFAENAEPLVPVIAEIDPPRRRKISLVTRPGPPSAAAKVFAEPARGAAA
jgi:DNA-binding transcriptional LysR family regulator